MIRALGVIAAVAALAALCGCESTVDAAKKFAASGAAAFKQKGISVGAVNRDIEILGTSVIQDQNGAAVVIDVRNIGTHAAMGAPIAINVKDAHGHSVFRNNEAGLEPALAHLPLLAPGEQFSWINDQVQPNGTPKRVVARIGTAQSPRPCPSELPISQLKLTNDPVSGAELSGKVQNSLSVPQTHLVIFAVAKKGNKIVAAGRAILTKRAPRQDGGLPRLLHWQPSGRPAERRRSRNRDRIMSTSHPHPPLLPECNAALAPDQRYCLNCGHRLTAPRVDFERSLGLQPAPAPVEAKPNRWERVGPLQTLMALGAVLLALGVGIVIGRGNGSARAAEAPDRDRGRRRRADEWNRRLRHRATGRLDVRRLAVWQIRATRSRSARSTRPARRPPRWRVRSRARRARARRRSVRSTVTSTAARRPASTSSTPAIYASKKQADRGRGQAQEELPRCDRAPRDATGQWRGGSSGNGGGGKSSGGGGGAPAPVPRRPRA